MVSCGRRPRARSNLPFMAMVKERKADYNTEVNGIVVGYSGHVPRARDKGAPTRLATCPAGRARHRSRGTRASPRRARAFRVPG